MKKILMAGLLLSSVAAWGHQDPVFAPRAVMFVEGDRLFLNVSGHSYSWVDKDVLGVELPPGQWPADLRERARDYVARRFVIEADGERLSPRLLGARVTQSPWQKAWKAQVRLRLVYNLPSAARTIKGRSEIYRECYDHHPVQDGGQAAGMPLEYWTNLRAAGRQPDQRRVTMWEPGFAYPREALERSFIQRSVAAFTEGFKVFFMSGSRLALLGAVYFTFSGPLSLAGILAGLFLGFGLVPWSVPLSMGVWILAMAVCAIPWAGARFFSGTWKLWVLAGAAAAGLAFSADFFQWRSAWETFERPRLLFLAGGGVALGLCAALLYALEWIMDRPHRHMDAGAREAARLHRRKMATALLLALCLYQWVSGVAG